MHRICRQTAVAVALWGLCTFVDPYARADSLTTVNGQVIQGTVTQLEKVYKIVTANGTITIAAERVQNVVYDHPPTDAPSTKSSTPTPTPAEATANPREVTAFTQQGLAAMAAGEFADARDAFSDLLSIDPKNTTAARGLGFAYLRLEKQKLALKPLEAAALSPPVDRNLALALASSLVAAHDPVRAAKFVRTYLEAHPTPPDEPLLNALGISLSQFDSASAKTGLFIEGVKLYDKLNADLESKQDGKRRWGVEWEDSEDVDKKGSVRQDAQEKVENAWAKLQSANAALSSAQTELTVATNSLAKKAVHDEMVQAAQRRVSAAKRAVEKSQSDFDAADKALQDIPGPPWPSSIVLQNSDVKMAPESVATLKRYAVGFAIAPNYFVTAGAPLDDSSELQVTSFSGKTSKAEVVRMLHGDGIALLKAEKMAVPVLKLASRPSGGSLTCMALPDVELFTPFAKQLTVRGNEQVAGWTVLFSSSPRLSGAPLMRNGEVVGVELADREGDLSQVPAATLKSLLNLVENHANASTTAADPAHAIVLVTASR